MNKVFNAAILSLSLVSVAAFAFPASPASAVKSSTGHSSPKTPMGAAKTVAGNPATISKSSSMGTATTAAGTPSVPPASK